MEFGVARRVVHSKATRERILAAVERTVKRYGYEGIGVDGIAKVAGVTSGAFYAHFPSKSAAFQEAVGASLRELRDSILRLQQEQPERWLKSFIDSYVGERRRCDLADACALQALTADVMRAGDEVRDAFQEELIGVIDAVAAGLPAKQGEESIARAWALLTLLSGGVTTARAIPDQDLAEQAADAVRSAALALAYST
ncbi:hypothetical protein UM91_18305 [Pseudomonas oryzihabitans]|jgi:AcrR family transcriptional regulator|nr:hypothetical protein UM91_18305 [Pseudomonas oryzihabitans]